MPSPAPGGSPHPFDLRSGHWPVVALVLRSTDRVAIEAAWMARFGADSDFFDNDPCILDLSDVADTESPLDVSELVDQLRRWGVQPVAYKGGHATQQAAAQAAGLAHADEWEGIRPPPTVIPHQAPAPAPVPPPPVEAEAALVVDRPLRSGQRVYAKGRDLVVMAMVNAGAEVIADGHIHVYAPLRGRAIAGARGNADARIFALALEAELVSIAGVYRTSDVPLPPNVYGKPAQVRLTTGPEGDRLLLEPLL